MALAGTYAVKLSYISNAVRVKTRFSHYCLGWLVNKMKDMGGGVSYPQLLCFLEPPEFSVWTVLLTFCTGRLLKHSMHLYTNNKEKAASWCRRMLKYTVLLFFLSIHWKCSLYWSPLKPTQLHLLRCINTASNSINVCFLRPHHITSIYCFSCS